MSNQQPQDLAPLSILDVLAEQRELFNEMLSSAAFSPDVAIADVMDDARTSIRGARSALDAEMWASEMLGMLTLAGLEPAAVDGVLVDVMVPAAEQEAGPEALAMLRAWSAVGSTALRPPAAAAAERVAAQGVADRRWAARIGRPDVGDCWVYGDVSGFQEAVAVTFGYGRKRHCVSVLIDHGMGGGVKDAWVADDPSSVLAQTRAMARDGDGAVTFEMLDPAEARSRLERALAAGECPRLPDQIEDVALTRALLRARVVALPEQPVPGSSMTIRGSTRGW